MTSSPAPVQADFLVIGGGIAGASVAFWLAPHARVVVLERESQPGYHATGRSAALFMESYGTPQVRALTMASRAFLEDPPRGFAEHPLLTPRGAMMVAGPGQLPQLEEHWRVLHAQAPLARRLSTAQACALVPALRPERVIGATYEPDAADMDVHAIHQGYLRGMRHAGGHLVCDANVMAIMRAQTRWQVQAGGRLYEAPVVLNAAGAWVDAIARLAGVRPLGIQPRRRSAFIFEPPAGMDIAAWPLVHGADEDSLFQMRFEPGVA
jgi:D-arginine dehydrogenase